MTLSSQIIK